MKALAQCQPALQAGTSASGDPSVCGHDVATEKRPKPKKDDDNGGPSSSPVPVRVVQGAAPAPRGGPARAQPSKTECPVSADNSMGTGAVAGSAAYALPHVLRTGIAALRGASTLEIVGEVAAGAAGTAGLVAVGGFIVVAGGVYAYDRYSGGKVTRFLRKHGVAIGGCTG